MHLMKQPTALALDQYGGKTESSDEILAFHQIIQCKCGPARQLQKLHKRNRGGFFEHFPIFIQTALAAFFQRKLYGDRALTFSGRFSRNDSK